MTVSPKGRARTCPRTYCSPGEPSRLVTIEPKAKLGNYQLCLEWSHRADQGYRRGRCDYVHMYFQPSDGVVETRWVYSVSDIEFAYLLLRYMRLPQQHVFLESAPRVFSFSWGVGSSLPEFWKAHNFTQSEHERMRAATNTSALWSMPHLPFALALAMTQTLSLAPASLYAELERHGMHLIEHARICDLHLLEYT